MKKPIPLTNQERIREAFKLVRKTQVELSNDAIKKLLRNRNSLDYDYEYEDMSEKNKDARAKFDRKIYLSAKQFKINLEV